MPGASLADLYGTAQRLLSLFIPALEGEGVTVPGTRYVSYGQEVAWDGEQLNVTIRDVYPGQPGIELGRSQQPETWVFTARFIVWLLTPVPVVQAGPRGLRVPPVAQMEAASKEAGDAVSAMMKAAITVNLNYQMTDVGMGFHIGPCMPVNAGGGLTATRLDIAMSVD